MPDHMHLFVRGGDDFKLAQWVNGLKRAVSVALGATKKRPLWQPGFFDHVLRNDGSYTQKWKYVRENPVRAGLLREPTIGSIKANSCSSIGHKSFAADTAASTPEW
jgi:putative transposase